MSNRKFFAFFVALSLLAAAAPALAASTPPAIADTYTLDGVTYYNVNSSNFDSNKKFYEDVFKAKHSSLGGRSMAQLWMMTAVGATTIHPLISAASYTSESIQVAKESALKDYGEAVVDYGYYSYTAPQWNNNGYVETTLVAQKLFPISRRLTFRVRFSDFEVGVILPGNANHYVSTSIESDTPKGEQASTTKNDTNNTVTIGQSLSKTITESISSTVDHSFSYSFTEGVKVGFETEASAGVVAFKISGESSFSATQTISDGWSKTDTQSASNTVGNSISVTLPPYTTAMLKQGESDSTVTTNYNCPVFLSYKVTIIGGFEGGLLPLTLTYPFGPKAREDLKKRAITDVDYDPQGIDWRTVLGDSNVKDAVEKIASHAPMSPTGAKMVYKNRTAYNEVTGIVPLYPLNAVDLEKPNISFVDNNKVANMEVGNYSYTEYLPVAGYNDRGAAYYGFNKSYGSWRVVDAAGNELTGDSAPVVLEKVSSGYTKFTAKNPGKCFLRYFIAENVYPSGLGSNSYTKNSDLSRIAQLEINVAGEKVTYQIDGEYSGLVNAEPENLETKGALGGQLEVHAYNADDIEVDAPYYWEKQELKGITLDKSGTVSFTKPGTFHVRVRNNADKSVYSAWKAIAAEVTGDDYVEQNIPIVRSEFADGDTQFVITGRFLGGANISESIEGEGKFQVETHTSNGQETAVQYTWEAQETGKGITIDGNGRVSFDNPGVYHVRLRSTKAASAEASTADADSGALTSDWLEVWVNETAPARLLQAPSAPDNYTNGAEQALVNGDARYEGGVRMFYGLASDDVTPATEYSSFIPEASAAGTYYVWCKVQGDENHTDSSPVCVTVTLQDSGSSTEPTPTPDGGNTDTPSGGSSASNGCDMGLSALCLALALPALTARRRGC